MRRLIPVVVALCAFVMAVSTATAATLFAPEYSNDRIFGLEIAAGGAASPIAGSPFDAASGGLVSFSTTPDGRKGIGGYFAPGAGGVRGFSVSPEGVVTPAQAKFGLAVNGVYSTAVSPDGRFAYAGTRYYPGSGDAGVRAYAFADNGALTEVSGSPFEPGYEVLDVAITPDGKFLYATVGMGLVAFTINPDGTLTSLGNTGGVVALWASASPDGRFIFVGGESSGKAAVFSFKVEANGLLTEVGVPVVFAGASPRPPAISPDGRFIYMAEQNDGAVHTVRVNPDGSLAMVGSLTGVDVDAAVVSPDSKTLYVSDSLVTSTLSRSAIGPDGVPGPLQKVVDFDPGEPVRMHFRTGFGAVAEFSAKPAKKTLTMTFDGSKSTAKQGAVGSYDWLFGDGGSAANGGASISHKFAKPGVYEVALTARDSGGCGSERIFLGQTAPCMGSPESVKTVKVDTPPWITAMSVSPRRVGSKAKIKFKLTEKARVTFVVQKPAAGRLVGKSCRKPSAKNRKGKRCTRWLRASKSFRANGKKGSNSLKFTGKIGSKTLKNGRYRLAATAVDRAKGKSPQRTAAFRKR